MSTIASEWRPPPDLPLFRTNADGLRAEIGAAGKRLAGMLAEAPPDLPVPGLTWTVHQLAAHVTNDSYLRLLRGEESPYVLDQRTAVSEAMIEQHSQESMSQLADQLSANVEGIVTALGDRDPSEPAPWHDGQPLTVGLLGGLMLNELVVHTVDLARAMRAPSAIPESAASLGIGAALAAAPYMLRPGQPTQARIEIRVRGVGAVIYDIDGDDMTLLGPISPVDAHISADPVTMLGTTYGRAPQMAAIASGRLRMWGRRWWRLSALTTRFAAA